MTDPARIAVYGASGHTGRLVAAELVAQDQELVLVGRTGDALAAVAGEIGGRCRVQVAELDDAAALHAALSDADAVVNCAGPFSRSSRPVASAAIANGAHYVDHAAEPLAVMNLFAELSAPARAAGVVVIPSMSFYGATADLLSALVSRDQASTAEVTVAYAVNGWRMTTASKHTAALLAGTESVSYTHGAFTVGAGRATPRKFEFPAAIGIREVMTFPAGAEIVTIPRHVSAPSVQVLITTETFQEEFVYTSEELDAADRADSEFLLVVQAASAQGVRRGVARGHDIYRVGARMAVEAALDLARGLAGVAGGVHGAAEVFDAEQFLGRQQGLGSFTVEIHA